MIRSSEEDTKFIVEDQEEIRINHDYTSILLSNYKSSLKGNSTPKKRTRIISSKECFQRIINSIQKKEESMMLPMYCRYVKHSSNLSVYVLEEPPAFRTLCLDLDLTKEVEELKVTGKLDEYGYTKYFEENPYSPYMVTLAMPFSIFILIVKNNNTVCKGMFFFRNQPLTGLADTLFKAPLTNIDSSQQVCFGRDVGEKVRSGTKAIEQARTSWWTSVFNSDYIYNYQEYQNVAGVSNYLTWQFLSQKDPMFIYKIDWIPVQKSVKKIVNECLDSTNNCQPSIFDYNRMISLLTNPVKTEKSKKLKPEYLLYDISGGIMLGSHPLNIGDPLILKNEEVFYITSFAGYAHIPRYILMTSDKREFLFKLTQKSKKFLKQKIIEQRYLPEVVTPNGIVLKANQIISMKNIYNQKKYKKVYYIRPAMDGKQEVKLGNEFFLVENLTEELEIVNTERPNYCGVDLIKDKTYFLSKELYDKLGIKCYSSTIFKGIEASINNQLMLAFEEIPIKNKEQKDTTTFIDINSRQLSEVFDPLKLKKIPNIFAIGRRVYITNTNKIYKNNYNILITTNDILSTPIIKEVVNECLKNNSFCIRTNALDIEFNIGDKVVAADAKNSINSLTIKTITGFEIDSKNKKIMFILMDNQKNISKVIYVNEFYNGCAIYVGRIRKISNSFNKVFSGTKIAANIRGIISFPKKDINIIIGFLTDTGGDDPLVLCSNGCTLWFSDMIEKFKLIPLDSSEWKPLKHVPMDTNKIKIQPGDIVSENVNYGNAYGFLITRNIRSKGLTAVALESYNLNDDRVFNNNLSRNVVFDCIPNPRISPKECNEVGIIKALPNFHGLYISSKNMTYGCHMINDQRRIINV